MPSPTASTSAVRRATDWRLPPDLDPTARAVITAARTCFADRGFGDVTMTDIAERAGVGVATVYRRFGQRETLVRYALIDESMRFSGLLAEVAAAARGPEDLLAGTFAVFAQEAAKPNLLVRRLRESSEAAELTAFLSADNIVAYSRSSIATGLRAWQDAGEIPADLDLDVVAEILSRLVISLIDSPADSAIPTEDPEAARAFARTYLMPLLQTHRA